MLATSVLLHVIWIVTSLFGEPLVQINDQSTRTEECPTTTTTTVALQPTLPQESSKKKKFGFLDKEIEIINPDEVEYLDLLSNLETRFRSRAKHWERRATCFRYLNMSIIITVILIQVFQVVVINIDEVSPSFKHLIGTVAPAIATAVIGLQTKLKLDEKSKKCKSAAVTYDKMLKVATYRLELYAAGGRVKDIADLWNDYLKAEVEDIVGPVLPI
ncbi:uncharacterized protein LOC144742398 isoform X1 [Ciona intestinalis]